MQTVALWYTLGYTWVKPICNPDVKVRQEWFVVSLSGLPWHSVALNEAFEMKLNMKCKIFIVHQLIYTLME